MKWKDYLRRSSAIKEAACGDLVPGVRKIPLRIGYPLRFLGFPRCPSNPPAMRRPQVSIYLEKCEFQKFIKIDCTYMLMIQAIFINGLFPPKDASSFQAVTLD